MAVSLGLHQEVTSSDMNAIELEHRRRVWWSAYSMDRQGARLALDGMQLMTLQDFMRQVR